MTVFGISVNRRQFLLLLFDSLLILLGIVVANYIRLDLPLTLETLYRQLTERTGASVFAIIVHLTTLYIFECYRAEYDYRNLRMVLRIALSMVMAAILLSILYFFLPNWRFGRGVLTMHTLTVFFGVLIWRLAYSQFLMATRSASRVAIFGASAMGRLMTRTLTSGNHSEYEMVCLFDIRDSKQEKEIDGFKTSKPDVERLYEQLSERRVNLVVLADPDGWDDKLLSALLDCRVKGIQVVEMVSLFKRLTGRLPIQFLEDLHFLIGPGFSASSNTLIRNAFRIFDIAAGSLGLLVTLPLQLLIGLCILLFNGRPILFAQERLGLNEVPFTLYKFRTMGTDAEKSGPQWSSRDDSRVTRLGRFLRRSRLDELPQLWNVVVGNMSIIGPRPERRHFVDDLKKQIPFYGLRFAIRPGLTGWAQVNYRYGASVDDAIRKLEYELYHIQEMSLFLNILILVKTVQTVLLRPGS